MAHRFDVRCGCDRSNRRLAVAGGQRQDAVLLRFRWIVDDHVEHEAIELRLGQRIGALLLDRVLRREHEQRTLERVADAVHRHLVFLHRLEQGRLRLRRRAVDLVGEDHVGKDRPGDEADLAAPADPVLLDHFGADDVRRHQVRRELDAVELQVNRLRQAFDQQRFRQPRHAAEQHVSAGEKRGQDLLNHRLLADNRAAELVSQPAGEALRLVEVHRAKLYRGSCRLQNPMIAALVLAAAVYSGRDNQLHVTPARLETPAIVVDGALDEPAWQQAARLTDFSQYSPVDGRPADDATEIFVFYSPTTIYFGVKAHAAPGAVHATLANRDRIDADDAIQIFLNPFKDGRQALVFGVNPFGIQADGALVEGTNNRGGAAFGGLESGREVTDLTPDYVFQSKGRLTDYGYEVEIAIPFKTLRFPSERVQSWALNIVRRVQSSGHEDSWTPALRAKSSFLAQSGTLDGLTDLRRGLVLDLNPVVTAHSDGAPTGTEWNYDTSRPEFGGNVRWGVTPNLTMNGTINPDFSQVEADASQFTFDPRSALFFPEKRPFFLDGAELFSAPNNLIYTRRIAAPLTAIKLTGKSAGTDIALLSAVDDTATSATGVDHPIFNVVRLQHDLPGASKVGVVYTDRIDGANSNRVFAADTRLLFGSIYNLQLQAGGSRTVIDGQQTTAPIWQAIFNRDGRHFGLRYQTTGIHGDFFAGSGFISRNGIISTNLTHRVTWFGAKDAPIQSYTLSVLVNGVRQYRSNPQAEPWLEKKLHFNNNFKFQGGWLAGVSALFESFGFDEPFYANYGLQGGTPSAPQVLPFTGVPNIHNADYVVTLNTPQFSRFSGSVFYIWGRDENFYEWAPADIKFATLAVEWRPNDKVRVSPQYQLQSYNRRTDGTRVASGRIPRLKVEYQMTRAIFLRAIGEYNAQQQDTLRDDSRTNLPIVIRDPATGLYAPASAVERNRFRVDALFSYQPTPGTVFFAGYSSFLTEPRGLQFGSLRRTNDGFFLKASYLFRL